MQSMRTKQLTEIGLLPFARSPRWYEAVLYGLMMLMSASAALSWRIGVWAMVAVCGMSAVQAVFTRRVGNRTLRRSERLCFYSMLAYWLLYVVGTLYSPNPKDGWHRVGMMLPTVLLPLFFLLTDLSWLSRQGRSGLVYVLAATLTVRFVVMAVRAGVRYAAGIPVMELVNFHFDPLHHNYLSMYLLAAIGLLYSQLVNVEKWKVKILLMADMALLSLYVVILASRSALIVLAVVVVACVLHLWLVRHRWQVAIVAVGVVLTLGIGSYLAAPQLYVRVGYTLDRLRNGTPLDSRQTLWQCGLELMEGRWATGWGVEGYWEPLRESYRAHDFAEGYEPERYNTHNQYLETTLCTGLPGLTVLMVMVLLPVAVAMCRNRNAGRDRNLPLLLFSIVYGGFLFFEVALARQMGLLFICWWYGLLLTGQPSNKQQR